MSAIKGFSLPNFDFNTIFDIQRKNIEAITAASQTFSQGLQTVAKRQSEIARQQMEQFQSLLTTAAPTAKVEDGLHGGGADQGRDLAHELPAGSHFEYGLLEPELDRGHVQDLAEPLLVP